MNRSRSSKPASGVSPSPLDGLGSFGTFVRVFRRLRRDRPHQVRNGRLGSIGRALGAPHAYGCGSGCSRVPRRPRTTPEQCLSAFGAPSAVAHACGTIFHLFCVVARKLRCAFRISFSGVLLTSDEVSTARARTAKTLENRGVSASKIEPGSVRSTQNREPG